MAVSEPGGWTADRARPSESSDRAQRPGIDRARRTGADDTPRSRQWPEVYDSCQKRATKSDNSGHCLPRRPDAPTRNSCRPPGARTGPPDPKPPAGHRAVQPGDVARTARLELVDVRQRLRRPLPAARWGHHHGVQGEPAVAAAPRPVRPPCKHGRGGAQLEGARRTLRSWSSAREGRRLAALVELALRPALQASSADGRERSVECGEPRFAARMPGHGPGSGRARAAGPQARRRTRRPPKRRT